MVSGCLLSLESPNNNECNGKENVKTNRFHKQNNNLHAQHTVWYISLPSLHDHDVNFLMRRVMQDVNTRWRNSLPLSNLECGPQEFNPRVNSPTTRSNKRDQVRKMRILFRCDLFNAVAIFDAKAPHSSLKQTLQYDPTCLPRTGASVTP